MNASDILTFLAGTITPLASRYGRQIISAVLDWWADRRYWQQWDKISAEFDRLSEADLSALRATWDREPARYGQYSDDRARYFAMRSKIGRVKEVV